MQEETKLLLQFQTEPWARPLRSLLKISMPITVYIYICFHSPPGQWTELRLRWRRSWASFYEIQHWPTHLLFWHHLGITMPCSSCDHVLGALLLWRAPGPTGVLLDWQASLLARYLVHAFLAYIAATAALLTRDFSAIDVPKSFLLSPFPKASLGNKDIANKEICSTMRSEFLYSSAFITFIAIYKACMVAGEWVYSNVLFTYRSFGNLLCMGIAALERKHKRKTFVRTNITWLDFAIVVPVLWPIADMPQLGKIKEDVICISRQWSGHIPLRKCGSEFDWRNNTPQL